MATYGQEVENKSNTTILASLVSIHVENKTIETLLLTLEENYPFSFSYIDSEIPLQKKISLTAREERLDFLLETVFKNTVIDFIDYEDQIILIRKKNIEILEEIKDKHIQSFYLPTISEYSSNTKGKGNFIDIDDLLKRLTKYYQSYKANPNLAVTDTIKTDSLSIKFKDSLNIATKKRRKKTLKFPKLSMKNVELTYGFSAKISSVFWTFSSETRNRDFNKNAIPDVSLAIGGDLYFEAETTVTSLGFHFSYLQKTGIHTNYFVNTVFPNTILTQSTSYNENFMFAEIPATLGFKILKPKFNYFIQSGISLQRLVQSDVSKLYRVYQDQLFTNLNSNSASNPDLSPYFDRNFTPIETKTTRVRKWNTSAFISFRIVTKWSDHWKIIIGPEISYQFFSLYENDAPVSQNRIQAGIGIIFAPIFTYM